MILQSEWNDFQIVKRQTHQQKACQFYKGGMHDYSAVTTRNVWGMSSSFNGPCYSFSEIIEIILRL